MAARTDPPPGAYGKGEEMGWFEHGSTIIVLAPEGFALCPSVREGTVIRMGRRSCFFRKPSCPVTGDHRHVRNSR
jgi:phosphatidylserine decarboxylase